MDRRTMLAGLAGLPLAAASLPAPAAAADPFTGYHAEILALHDAMTGQDDEACDPFMRRWGEVDRLAMAGQPITLAGALGAVQYARREFHQFHVEALQGDRDGASDSDLLILHLMDGALGVLRQAIEGGRA